MQLMPWTRPPGPFSAAGVPFGPQNTGRLMVVLILFFFFIFVAAPSYPPFFPSPPFPDFPERKPPAVVAQSTWPFVCGGLADRERLVSLHCFLGVGVRAVSL